MTFARWTALFGLTLSLCMSRRAHAAVIDTANFTETTWFAAGGTRTGMAWAPDGSNRLFLLDKDGAVDIVKWGAPPAMVRFATITPIYTSSECGLVGLTFDPNFQVNHYVYFFVTVSASEQQIIRYTAAGDVGTDKTVILAGLPTAGANHDGGAIGFGPDGKLYWGIGDLGSGVGVNEDLTSLAAKIGRANRDGTVPNDNPFFDGSGPNNDYVFARGFRNPFTSTFQPATGALWVNVVGTSYEQAFVVGRGDHAGYSAYENDQPAGFITPVIKYRTNGTDTRAIAASGAVRASGVVTFTTTATHGFRQGEKITVAGVGDATFNGAFYVTSVPTATTFAVVQTGANATSGGGDATTLDQGGCITGGSFYDGTQFPAAYRGNFFYGDYNSGRLMRAVVGAGNAVTSVDYWATGIASATDTAVGPDGALYYTGIGGTIYRATFNTATQSIVVSSTHVWMTEAGQSSVNVRLAAAPTADMTLTAARIAGDADVSVGPGAVLTFTPSNWNVPQPLTFAAADDLDVARDTATIQVSGGGLAPESIIVNVIDDDTNNFVVSQASLALVEGGSGTFTVALAAAPQAALSVTVARTTGDTDIGVASGATLVFDSTNFATPQTVTIAAAEDPDTANDSASVDITGSSMVTRSVSVTVSDNDPIAPLITSTPPAKAVINASYRYDVVASGFPAPTFSLASSPPGMTIDATAGSLRWTPSQLGAFMASVVADNGVAPNATQAFTIDVGPDAAPTCALTRPVQGERVFGRTAEFYGDGFDDVGATKADFFIDGVLASTDANTAGHYHFAGEHNRWDTTTLSDGTHKAKMTVSDTIGQTCSVEVDVIVANLADGGVSDAADGAGDRQDGGTSDGASDVTRDVDTRDVGIRDRTNVDTGADRRDGGAADPGEPAGGTGCGCVIERTSRPMSRAWIGMSAALLLAAARRRRASRRGPHRARRR
jgi:glucose/arabinose dehydrogenase